MNKSIIRTCMQMGNWDLRLKNWKEKRIKGYRSEHTRFLGCRYRWWQRLFQRQSWACWERLSCERRWKERRRKRASIARRKLWGEMRSEIWRLDPPLILAERKREKWRVNEGERERGDLVGVLFWCVVYYKVVILRQIFQPLGFVSKGAKCKQLKMYLSVLRAQLHKRV